MKIIIRLKGEHKHILHSLESFRRKLLLLLLRWLDMFAAAKLENALAVA